MSLANFPHLVSDLFVCLFPDKRIRLSGHFAPERFATAFNLERTARDGDFRMLAVLAACHPFKRLFH